MSAQAAALALHSQSPGIEAAPAGSRPRPVRIRVDWTLVNDEVLVRGCVSQDDDAYAELVRRYEGSLFNVAYRLLGRYDKATDATQQALVQAYVALPTSRLGLPVRPWLFRILRNHCIDRLRRKDAIPFSRLTSTVDGEDSDLPIDAPDGSPLPEEIAERSDLECILRAAIDGLQPRYRTVVLLRYVGDLSFAEIGSCLGVPEPTARTLFQRAKVTLRKTLAGQL
jgi:RNA polymerase sigma factor (sigma-70 family)